MEKQNFWQTQLFESSEILLRSRAVRIFLNVRNLWMCRVGTALFLRFCPLHFARHPALGLGGNEFLNGFSKYFSAYLKAKVIYVTVNPSFRKSDDSRAGVGMSRRCLKNMQKLRQKIFEDHLRPPPANCFDKQANPTDHKTILQISKYWNRNPLSCMRGNDRFFLEENNCQAIRVKFSRYIVPILGSAKCNQFGCLLWKCHQNFVRQDRAAFTSNYALTENHVDCWMTKFTPIKTLIVHHIGFQGIT